MRILLGIPIVFIIFFFTACSYSKINKKIQNPNLPLSYNNQNINMQIEEKWLNDFKDKDLINLVNKALTKNYNLKQVALDIKIKEQELRSTNSLFFPSLNFNYTKSRNDNFENSYNNISSNLSFDIKYEVDIWQKLSDQKKKANINLLEAKAKYKQKEQVLIANLASAYYDVLENISLIELYEKKLKNTKDNFFSIKSRYSQGLSSSLDVYSAKSSYLSQEAKLIKTRALKKQAIYKLEEFLGEYPKGLFEIKKDIPLLQTNVKLGLPSQLLYRKPSLIAAWNTLLSKDFSLAIAHKNRFPSLNLSLSIKDSFEKSIPLSWSILGGLSASIFDAGKLESFEKIAFYEVKKAEFNYLNEVYSAFVEIETLKVEEKSLKEEYLNSLKTYKNAKKSFELSFSQYLKGIVEYPTVLSLQKSFYDLETQIIGIKIKMLKNTINLHKSLGGDYI